MRWQDLHISQHRAEIWHFGSFICQTSGNYNNNYWGNRLKTLITKLWTIQNSCWQNVKLTKFSSSKDSTSKDSFKSPGLFGFVLWKRKDLKNAFPQNNINLRLSVFKISFQVCTGHLKCIEEQQQHRHTFLANLIYIRNINFLVQI